MPATRDEVVATIVGLAFALFLLLMGGLIVDALTLPPADSSAWMYR